jgi:hypothetical protein
MGNGTEARITQYLDTGQWITAGAIAERVGVNRHGGLYESLREAGIDELKIGGHSLFAKDSSERFITKKLAERVSELKSLTPVIPVGGEENAGKLSHRVKELEAQVEGIKSQLTKIANAFGGWGQFDKSIS